MSIWWTVKFVAIGCIVLYLAKTRRDNIFQTTTSAQCNACYDKATPAARDADPLILNRYIEMGYCNAELTPQDDNHPHLLREHNFFFDFSPWRGNVSEVKYFVYYGAIYFVALVLICVYYIAVPWFYHDSWSSWYASVTVFIVSLHTVLALMPLHWFYRLYAVSSQASGDAATCFVSALEPVIVTANMIAPLAVLVPCAVAFIVALCACQGDDKNQNAGPLVTVAISGVAVSAYAAFVLWYVIANLSLTHDYWVLGAAIAAAITPIELLILVVSSPAETAGTIAYRAIAGA